MRIDLVLSLDAYAYTLAAFHDYRLRGYRLRGCMMEVDG